MDSKTKIAHFRNYGRIALTIASREVPNRPNYYVLGMALAHKNDNGSKADGREIALNRLQDGLTDFALEEHIKEMSIKGDHYRGQKGHYVIRDLGRVKRLINDLHFLESTGMCGCSKLNSIYHKVFFDLIHQF